MFNRVLQVAELLLVRGLAQVVRHRSDDERSGHYESLMNAESSGMSSKKGMHNKSKDPPVHYYNDVSLPSSSANQAKQYLPFFQRGKQKGIVEFVLSGARLKVRGSMHMGFPDAPVSCITLWRLLVRCLCILFDRVCGDAQPACLVRSSIAVLHTCGCACHVIKAQRATSA